MKSWYVTEFRSYIFKIAMNLCGVLEEDPRSWFCVALPDSEVREFFSYVEIGRGRSIYSMETGKCYKSGLGFYLSQEAGP